MAEDPLQRYRDKRRFERTPEPSGEVAEPAGNRFVVQKHAARRLHYDVRLETDGVMASWAVPRGPSYDPKAKRLAVHVEDHPIDYRTFEGTIPRGEYGGGAVIVWDAGTYRNLTERDGNEVSVRKAIEGGHLSVWFEGTKLHGGWSFTRTRSDGQDSWLLIKRRDEHADADLDIEEAAPDSVQSGKDVDEVARDPDSATWTRATATWQPPMLAELAETSTWLARAGGGRQADDWTYERKLDGLRCVAVRNGDRVELWSRNHLSFTDRFRSVVEALGELPVDNFVLDGELVAADGEELLGFGALQDPDRPLQTCYCVFDVLHLLGRDTRDLGLDDRRRLLTKVVPPGSSVLRPVDTLEGTAEHLLDDAKRGGWEGLIAKRKDSTYVSGRSPAWRKLKLTASQELVIGGWTDPQGARTGFGALLVGYFEEGRLRYAGKVGTGFSQAALRDLGRLLAERASEESPFAERVPVRGAHWVRPDLVAAIGFSEWTRDLRLRQPRYQGLRPDKDAREVVREAG